MKAGMEPESSVREARGGGFTLWKWKFFLTRNLQKHITLKQYLEENDCA